MDTNTEGAIVFTPGHAGVALSTDGRSTVLIVDDAKLGRFLLPLDHETAVALAVDLAAVATVGGREVGA